jgi:2'-5' RNA ligase
VSQLNKRIFLALNLPQETKNEITKKYGKTLEELKKVKKENLHITLLFLGYFPEEKIKEIKEKLKKIKHEKFQVLIKGIGSFNSRVIFLKIEEGKEKIKELHHKISNALEIKDERFNPHLTIARNKKLKKEKFNGVIKELKKISFEKRIEIKEFDLMESILSPTGAKYKKIYSFELEFL